MSNSIVLRYGMENSDITYPIHQYIFGFSIMLDPFELYYKDYKSAYISSNSWVYLTIRFQ